MQVTGHVYHASAQEVFHKRTTALSNTLTLITCVAMSALIGFGATIGVGVVLGASLGIAFITGTAAVLGGAIGVIICIFRSIVKGQHREPHPNQSQNFHEKPRRVNARGSSRRRQSHSAARSINPVKGYIGNIKISTIHQLKLMAQSPNKRYDRLYDCVIVFKNGGQEHFTFAPEVYNAFLKALPPERKNLY